MDEKEISNLIIERAVERQSDQKTASSDLVAAIHATLMDIGLLLNTEMENIRYEERTKELG